MNKRSSFIVNKNGDVKLFYLVDLKGGTREVLDTSDYAFEDEIDTNIFDLYEQNQVLQHQLEEKEKVIDKLTRIIELIDLGTYETETEDLCDEAYEILERGKNGVDN